MQTERIIDGFSKRKVLVIGDLIVDRYIWGKVDRISPEAPVPVVEVTREEFSLGGAANVANNIVSLGGCATLVGICGKDSGGDAMKGLLNQAKIECALVEDARPTSEKTRVIAHNQQVVRFDKESKASLSGSGLKRMLDTITDLLPAHDAVIISDYKKGVINPGLMKKLMAAAGKKYFIAVDPKVGHFHLYKGVSLITPNLNEAAQGASIQIIDDHSLINAGRKLVSSLRAGAVLITRGEQGMSLFAGRKVKHIPTAARKVFDVTGAGDTVIAAFTLAHASGASLEQSAALANYAAGIVVAQVGTAAATAKALKKAALNHTDEAVD